MARILNACAIGIALVAAALAAGAQDADGKPYRIVDGKVDARTFLGWNMYQATCVTCHGADGLGTPQAPDLTAKVAAMGPKEFEVKVLNRYLVQMPAEEMASEAGRAAVQQAFMQQIAIDEGRKTAAAEMPIWENNPAVRERIDALYAYLRARADGALGTGRPGLMK